MTTAGLQNLFDDPTSEPLTLFAPTDDAFTALGLTNEELTSDLDRLNSILTYHATDGEVPANALPSLTEFTTVEGSNVEVDDGGTSLNSGTNIIQTDLLAANGIVHAVDQVLVPPTVDLSATTATASAASASKVKPTYVFATQQVTTEEEKPDYIIL